MSHLRLSLLGVFISGFLLAGDAFCLDVIRDRKQAQAQAHYMMGLFYENQNKSDEALYEYDQALRLEKGAASLYLHRGIVLTRKGDFEKAIESLEEAKRLEPQSLEPGFALAVIYTIRDSPDKASAEFEDVLKKASSLQPGNIDILKNLSIFYYQQKRFEDALSVSKLILNVDKSDYEAVFLHGSILEETGRRQEAIAAFKQALELNPEYPDALNSLGYLYAEENINLDEAEGLIKKALSIDPDNGSYVDSLGWVYFKMDRIDYAQEYLERAVKLFADPEIYEHLGDVYIKKGLTDNAEAAWMKSLELDSARNEVKKKLDNLKQR